MLKYHAQAHVRRQAFEWCTMKRILYLFAFFLPFYAFAGTLGFGTSQTGTNILHGIGASTQDQAQSFVADETATGVTLSVATRFYHGTGDDSGSVTVYLYSDNAGAPDTLLYTGNTIANTSLLSSCSSGSNAWTFSSVDLTASTQYWLIFRNSADYGTDPVVTCGDYANGFYDEGVYAGGTFYSDGAGYQMYQQLDYSGGTPPAPTSTPYFSSSTDAQLLTGATNFVFAGLLVFLLGVISFVWLLHRFFN